MAGPSIVTDECYGALCGPKTTMCIKYDKFDKLRYHNRRTKAQRAVEHDVEVPRGPGTTFTMSPRGFPTLPPTRASVMRTSRRAFLDKSAGYARGVQLGSSQPTSRPCAAVWCLTPWRELWHASSPHCAKFAAPWHSAALDRIVRFLQYPPPTAKFAAPGTRYSLQCRAS